MEVARIKAQADIQMSRDKLRAEAKLEQLRFEQEKVWMDYQLRIAQLNQLTGNQVSFTMTQQFMPSFSPSFLPPPFTTSLFSSNLDQGSQVLVPAVPISTGYNSPASSSQSLGRSVAGDDLGLGLSLDNLGFGVGESSLTPQIPFGGQESQEKRIGPSA
jgi:hypothetical protein